MQFKMSRDGKNCRLTSRARIGTRNRLSGKTIPRVKDTITRFAALVLAPLTAAIVRQR